jgi:hypothetical protein
VIGDGGVPVIAAGAQMRGNPLALQKDLDGARRQPHLDPTWTAGRDFAIENGRNAGG